MQPRSVRLNQELREDFINTVVNEIMPDEKEPTIEKFQDAYAQSVYDATYGLVLPTMQQLPDWAIVECRSFFVQLGEKPPLLFQLPDDGKFFYNQQQGYSSYGNQPNKGSVYPSLECNHPIAQAFEAQKQALADWKTKRQALKQQLQELTTNCNTSGQLFKTWPKAMEFAYVFPQPEVKERAVWTPSMDAAELDLGIELSQVEVAPIKEN